jgi:SAM-dependent methyltransferase
MGLGPQLITDLAQLRRCGQVPSGGSVVEIGAQQLSNPFLRATDDLDELYRLFGRSPPRLTSEGINLENLGPSGFSAGLELQSETAPSSRAFWESLGFRYAAIDYGGHRDAIALDLNRDQVPSHLASCFDLVVNTGTTEHVSNQDNAFRIIHDLTAPGGLMIHDVPAGGMLTHGLFGYNMQFFFVLCRDNAYDVLDLGLVFCGSALIHADIVSSNAQFARFSSHHDPRFSRAMNSDMEVPVFMIRAILRKSRMQPYMTPLDLPEDHVVNVRSKKINK